MLFFIKNFKQIKMKTITLKPGESITVECEKINTPKEKIKQAIECSNIDELTFLGGSVYAKEESVTYPVFIAIPVAFLFGDKERVVESNYCPIHFFDYLKQENLRQGYDDFLLEKAEREYPKGTLYLNVHKNSKVRTSNGKAKYYDADSIMLAEGDGFLYRAGIWAEKLEPIFTTEDGIEWYKDSREYAAVHEKTLKIYCNISVDDFNKDTTSILRFSIPEAAGQWVKKEKGRRGEEKSIDKVTVQNLDVALRMCDIDIHERILCKIIDLVELIKDKGDLSSMKDVAKLQKQWNKNRS